MYYIPQPRNVMNAQAWGQASGGNTIALTPIAFLPGQQVQYGVRIYLHGISLEIISREWDSSVETSLNKVSSTLFSLLKFIDRHSPLWNNEILE